jgi:cytochrome c oxidase subunit IV
MSHTAQHEENHGTGEIKKVTIILSVLTIVELLLGFWMMDISSEALRLAIKGSIIILMMAKAFYIVAYFMHLKHELKNLIMTIVVPLGLFVWFIGAFLIDGNSFKNLRNTYDPYFKERSTIKVEQKSHGGHGAASHGEGASHEAAADTAAHAKDTMSVENKH